jgi:hypothetical protein
MPRCKNLPQKKPLLSYVVGHITRKYGFFHTKNFINGTRVDELGGFIHYNAQYVMFIVTYIILKMGI